MTEDFTEFCYMSSLISSKPIEVEPPPFYRYEALASDNSIRLVQLHAGEPAADIRVTVVQTTLEEVDDYEAISYVWGDESNPQETFCGPRGQQLSVTKNCASILRRLRQPNAPRLIWIDAICINQRDIPERNAQVSMMGEIYQKASGVIIDIGEASPRSDFALDALIHCSELGLYPMEIGLKINDAVGELYRRPWFKRVWVLQEVFRATEAVVICGSRFVPWKHFRPFKIWIDSRPANETEPWHSALPVMVPYALVVGNHQNRAYISRNDLLAVLCKARFCDATDPRDKFFALLPMLEGEEGLKADYKKSPEKVYVELGTWLLAHFGLSFLSCVHPHWNIESKLCDLPSWVPDWSLQIRDEWLLGLGAVYYPLLAASNSTSVAEVLFPTGGTPTLKVRCIIVDKIRTDSRDLDVRTSIMENPRVAEFLAECHKYRMGHPQGSVAMPNVRYWKPKTTETRLHPPDWMAYDYGLPLEYPMDKTDNDMADLITYFCSGRKLAMTERGYLGLVPDKVEIGDVVCCFLGSGVPFVLREVKMGLSGEQRFFKLIGESYIYGLMEGEALVDVDLTKASEKIATLPLRDIYIL